MNHQVGSVTRLIPDLLTRNELAIEQIWQRYVSRMEGLARPYLVGIAAGAGDEQDVAQSAFIAFCEAAAQGNAPALGNRNELWRLLATIARNKAADRVRHAKRQRRGGGRIASQLDVAELEAREPTASRVVLLQEAMNRLLKALQDSPDPKIKVIALKRLEGFSTQEIASELNCAVRTVQRKLHLLERLWCEQVN
jgi:RNA polymerase sigma factor (sigma-70 family)